MKSKLEELFNKYAYLYDTEDIPYIKNIWRCKCETIMECIRICDV